MSERTMRRMGRAAGLPEAGRPVEWHVIYEALVPLACAICRRAIPPGDVFTRRRLARGVRVAAICRACAPFTAPG